jgi:hypothetical protein
MKKKSSDFIGKAFIISLILILVDLIGGFSHLRLENWYKWLSTVIMAAFIIAFCLQFGKQQSEGTTFGKVFGYGFKISLVISLLMVIYTLISFNLIFPEYMDQILQKARTDMEAKGGLSEEQIDTGIAMTKKFLQPVPLSIFSFIATLFFGTIASLLGAAFAKKGEPNVFQNNP